MPDDSSTASQPKRVVDAHVHHWSHLRPDLFPFLVDEDGLRTMTGLDDVSPLRRSFGRNEYLAEVQPWNVVKYVHVSAAMGPEVSYVQETRERSELATTAGQPDAIIGSVHPDRTSEQLLREIAEQASNPAFRGLRVNMGIDHASAPARVVLAELEDRRLTYEVWCHPDDMASAAELLSDFPSVKAVVGHMGWPLDPSPTGFSAWEAGLRLLADVGPQVHCKLSGLAQVLAPVDAVTFRPWIETAISIFGAERCFFASNFPVDSAAATFDHLFSVYLQTVSDIAETEQDALFASNAERFYDI